MQDLNISKRALRRHHKRRLLQKARKIVEGWFGPFPEETKELIAHRVYNNLKPCSCWMCGNPRKYEKKVTLQEYKHKLSFEEQNYN